MVRSQRLTARAISLHNMRTKAAQDSSECKYHGTRTDIKTEFKTKLCSLQSTADIFLTTFQIILSVRYVYMM
jgi:hypothetical protein